MKNKKNLHLGKKIAFVMFLCLSISVYAETKNTKDSLNFKKPLAKEKEALKFNLNDEGTHFFQAIFLNQAWLRYNESNPNTNVIGQSAKETFDIGLRRTRMQLFGQITDKVFLYFQFGQNNFNSMYNYSPTGGQRKQAAFIHDAVGEYKLSRDNQLKIGVGLTIANGLSRFSQPSVGTILTMDMPVFAQATVDQTDEFSRKLSIYARGQINHLDYRFCISDPFPLASNGAPITTISSNSTFAQKGHTKQYQAYVMWQFFNHEQHLTPYMNGTYLGKKKVFNIAAGIMNQVKAMWHKDAITGDTIYQNMTLMCIESFLDIPLNKEKGTALSAYAGYYNNNYGTNYLRYNGIMNPATSLSSTNGISIAAYGNAFPMFGTGQVMYAQLGYLLSKNTTKNHGQLLPYLSYTNANYKRLEGQTMALYNAGINWLINGQKAKITLDWQNRPTFYTDIFTTVQKGARKNAFTLQYQISF